MSTATRLIPLLLKTTLSLAVLGAGIFLFVMLGESRTRPQPPEAPPLQMVEAIPATTHDEGISFTVDGVVVPYREIELGTEVAGRVVYKADNARIGRTVQPDEVLLRIDPRDYQSEVDRLNEDVKQAENNLVELDVQIESAQGQLDLAEDNVAIQQRFLDREERLQERNATTDVNVDSARRDVLTARTAMQSQMDQLRLLKSGKKRLESVRERISNQLEQAQLELERTELKSPIHGVVIEELAERGGYLQKGTSVLKLRDISRYDVQCSLRVEQMKWLWESRDAATPETQDVQKLVDLTAAYDFPTTPVEVVYHTPSGEFIWEGVLSRYDGGGFDPQTRMIPCRVDVDEPLRFRHAKSSSGDVAAPPPSLMVGMFVEVRIRVIPQAALITLPGSAIYPGNLVWVVQDGKLSSRQVQVVTYEQDQAIVHSHAQSVRGGEQVVTSPLASPTDGAEVEVRPRS
ncbi:MAG: hypothetical protein WDZ51_04740 [Pirellulaceae bacterium]